MGNEKLYFFSGEDLDKDTGGEGYGSRAIEEMETDLQKRVPELAKAS